MFFEKNIVVSIGYNGVIVALHKATKITNKIFFKELNEENQKQLSIFFEKHKRAKIYILLDTIDQTYKKKFYPSVKRIDLPNLIKRDLGASSSKDSLKGYIIQKSTLDENKTKKWETILVSVSMNEEIAKWLDFLMLLPNLVVGVYTVPIESFSIIKKIIKNRNQEKELEEKIKNKAIKKNFFSFKKEKKIIAKKDVFHAYCLVVHCKISGYRQIIFSENGTILTRLVNYDISKDDFITNYEQDLYSTYEYLKRTFNDIASPNVLVINIVSKETVEKLSNFKSNSFEIRNFTPFQASKQLGIRTTITDENSYCDILLSRLFFKSKKLLLLKTPKITSAKRFFAVTRFSYYLNLFLIIFLFVEILSNINLRLEYEKRFDEIEVEKFKSYEELNKLQNKVLDSKGNEEKDLINIEKSIEFGKIDEVLSKKNILLFENIDKISFVKKHNLILDRIDYSIQGYNSSSPSIENNYSISLSGTLINNSGNIDDLFREFDYLTSDGIEIFSSNNIKYSKLPRDIDFNKKYYDFPVNFTITSK